MGEDRRKRIRQREEADLQPARKKQSGWLVRKLRSIFLYCGLSKEMYEAVRPRILEEDDRNMGMLTVVTTVFGFALTVLSLTGIVGRRVLPAYLVLLIASLIFKAVQRYYHRKGKTPPIITSYMQVSALMFYGICNSALFSPDPSRLGVTYCVLLIVPAFILLDRPARELPILIISTFFYLLAVYECKDPGTWSLEITNSVSFTFVGCLCFLIFTTKLVRNLSDQMYIEKERDMDSLTKVQTRQSSELMIQAQLDRGVGGAFFMLDVDDFKKVNDNWGHLYGDDVLRRVAGCITSNIRRMDVVGRYGGDEFIVYLPLCPQAEAEQIAENILGTMKQIFTGKEAGISCSIGITMADPTENLREIFDRADRAAYDVKRTQKGHFKVL